VTREKTSYIYIYTHTHTQIHIQGEYCDAALMFGTGVDLERRGIR